MKISLILDGSLYTKCYAKNIKYCSLSGSGRKIVIFALRTYDIHAWLFSL